MCFSFLQLRHITAHVPSTFITTSISETFKKIASCHNISVVQNVDLSSKRNLLDYVCQKANFKNNSNYAAVINIVSRNIVTLYRIDIFKAYRQYDH